MGSTIILGAVRVAPPASAVGLQGRKVIAFRTRESNVDYGREYRGTWYASLAGTDEQILAKACEIASMVDWGLDVIQIEGVEPTPEAFVEMIANMLEQDSSLDVGEWSFSVQATALQNQQTQVLVDKLGGKCDYRTYQRHWDTDRVPMDPSLAAHAFAILERTGEGAYNVFKVRGMPQ